uniref:Uncharacterized protein n=1 Tax=Anguilla anguilla TaxID=7936 RepID=A0A0E9TE87_ANGAN
MPPRSSASRGTKLVTFISVGVYVYLYRYTVHLYILCMHAYGRHTVHSVAL